MAGASPAAAANRIDSSTSGASTFPSAGHAIVGGLLLDVGVVGGEV